MPLLTAGCRKPCYVASPPTLPFNQIVKQLTGNAMSIEKWDKSSQSRLCDLEDSPTIVHIDTPSQDMSLSSGDLKLASTLLKGPGVDFKAYATVFGAFLALFCTFGQMNAFGTFQTWYSSHQLQHMPPSTISWIGSLQLWVFFVSVCLYRMSSVSVSQQVHPKNQGAPIGLAFDSYGPTALMSSGSMIFVASLMLTSISTQYYQYLLCQGILFGLGVGLLYVDSRMHVLNVNNLCTDFIRLLPVYRRTFHPTAPPRWVSPLLDPASVSPTFFFDVQTS